MSKTFEKIVIKRGPYSLIHIRDYGDLRILTDYFRMEKILPSGERAVKSFHAPVKVKNYSPDDPIEDINEYTMAEYVKIFEKESNFWSYPHFALAFAFVRFYNEVGILLA